MNRIAISRRKLANSLAGVLATALLAGCATNAAPSATVSAAEAQDAMARGKHGRAIDHAEAAVRAEPRNAAYRAMLADAYLDAGRFVSASSTFSDAFALGDRTPRTALSYALALIGAGLHNEAVAVLNAYEGRMPAADLGLALTLAGSPQRGIQLLENGIRAGENSVRIRQNLAYSYALAGRWREARLMAAQDLRGDLLHDRIEEWSRTADPRAWQVRVAGLLDVPAGVRDPGQPVELALANNPSIDQLAAEAAATAPAVGAPTTEAELPPVASVAAASPVSAPMPVATPAPAAKPQAFIPQLPPLLAAAPVRVTPPAPAIAAPAMPPEPAMVAAIPASDPALPDTSDFDAAFASRMAAGNTPSHAAWQAIRVALSAPAPTATPPQVHNVATALPATLAPAPAPAPRVQSTHLVQLGSFASRKNAERAKAIFSTRHPELSGHQMVITEAMVRGKRYWRVSAADFGARESRNMCSTLRARGDGCFAYAAKTPLPGSARNAAMLARR